MYSSRLRRRPSHSLDKRRDENTTLNRTFRPSRLDLSRKSIIRILLASFSFVAICYVFLVSFSSFPSPIAIQNSQLYEQRDYASLVKGKTVFQMEPVIRDSFPSFDSLLSNQLPSKSPSKNTICIITFSLIGPTKNGGLATADTSMAEALVESGYDVTVLYLWGSGVQSKTISYWVEEYGNRGIKLLPLKRFSRFKLSPSSNSKYIRLSYEAFLWLQDHHFDVLHFHEWHGQGYYTSLAKHQNIAFQNSLIVTTIHCPSLFYLFGSSMMLKSFNYLGSDFLERKQVEYSDVVISPSHYMLHWVQKNGWILPANTFVQQNILSRSVFDLKKEISPVSTEKVHVSEFVFFGRIEVLKGLFQFCDALDQLGEEVRRKELPNFRVTFMGNGNLGKGANVSRILFDRSNRKNWPFEVNVLTDFLQPEAVRYFLKSKGRVAVMPSLVENSPYAVLEALYLQIPFLVSDVGGVSELIDNAYHADVLFPPTRTGIVKALRKAVINGLKVAKASISPDENKQKWINSHHQMLHEFSSHNTNTVTLRRPLVTVCIAHFNRGNFLLQTLESLRFQTYPNFEVVIVDDGSTDIPSVEILQSVTALFSNSFRIEVIFQQNSFPGAARNNAVRHSRGEFVIFLDDDDIPKPLWISTMVNVSIHTNADVVTCMCDFFSGSDIPGNSSKPTLRWITVGAAPELGMFDNVFGAYSALVRSDSFWKIGGFSEEYGSTFEDYEFLARTVLEGFSLELVPEALLWYRQNPESHLMSSTNRFQNRMRALRPFLEKLPPFLRNALVFGYGNVKQRQKQE